MVFPKMEISLNIKTRKVKNEKHKKIRSKQIQKTLAKTRNLLAICPFCSADESFNKKQMRCFNCGIIVTQLKNYEEMVLKL